MSNKAIYLGGIFKQPFSIFKDRNLIFTGKKHIIREGQIVMKNRENYTAKMGNSYLFFTPLNKEMTKYNFLTYFKNTNEVLYNKDYEFNRYDRQEYNDFYYDYIYKLFGDNNKSVKSIFDTKNGSNVPIDNINNDSNIDHIEYFVVKLNEEKYDYRRLGINNFSEILEKVKNITPSILRTRK